MKRMLDQFLEFLHDSLTPFEKQLIVAILFTTRIILKSIKGRQNQPKQSCLRACRRKRRFIKQGSSKKLMKSLKPPK